MNVAVAAPPIENHLHFIWFGHSLPEFAQIAIASALERTPGATVTLWTGNALSNIWQLGDLRSRGLTVETINPEKLFAAVALKDETLPASQLEQIYGQLKKPAARANMVRMVVLFLYGGIYLDTDTLTVRDLGPLRSLGAFCGEEPTLWPAGTSKLNPRALLLGEVRRACSLVPGGHRVHNRMLSSYSMSANNAVVGARAGHPFLAHMLTEATRVPERERLKRYRLGTHLLQSSLQSYEAPTGLPEDEMHVLSTKHFYPLGPEISRQYFNRCSDPRAKATELLAPETFVIHWYASVADLIGRDAAYIRASATKNVYSYLCRNHVSSDAPVRLVEAVPTLA